MTDFPDVKLKALVQFPANVYGGTAISVVKENQNYTINVDFSEIAIAETLPPTDVPDSYALVYNSVTGVFTLVPIATMGI